MVGFDDQHFTKHIVLNRWHVPSFLGWVRKGGRGFQAKEKSRVCKKPSRPQVDQYSWEGFQGGQQEWLGCKSELNVATAEWPASCIHNFYPHGPGELGWGFQEWRWEEILISLRSTHRQHSMKTEKGADRWQRDWSEEASAISVILQQVVPGAWLRW